MPDLQYESDFQKQPKKKKLGEKNKKTASAGSKLTFKNEKKLNQILKNYNKQTQLNDNPLTSISKTGKKKLKKRKRKKRN